MFGIGGFELFLILLFGFLIFGPDKLPAMAKTLGKAIAKFRDAQEEMNKVIKTEVYDPNSDEPFKNPLDALDEAAAKAKKGADSAKKAASAVSKKASATTKKSTSTAAAGAAAAAAAKAEQDGEGQKATAHEPVPETPAAPEEAVQGEASQAQGASEP